MDSWIGHFLTYFPMSDLISAIMLHARASFIIVKNFHKIKNYKLLGLYAFSGLSKDLFCMTSIPVLSQTQ